MKQSDLKISVAILCFNAENHIANAIESALAQTFPAEEVIVIDDGSLDDSAAVIKNYPVRLIRHGKNLGLAAARNTAWRNALGDILVYLDADTAVDESFLEQLTGEYINRDVSGVGGEAVEASRKTIFDLWRHLFHNQSCGGRRLEGASMLPGLFSSYRKEVLEKTGGFDQFYRSHGEDVDFGMRLSKNGYRLIYEPSLKAGHLREDGFFSLTRYIYKHIYWSCIARRRNKKKTFLKFTLGSFSFGARAFFRSIFECKSMGLAALSLFALTVRLAAALFGSLTPVRREKGLVVKKKIMMINLSDVADRLCGGQEIALYNLVRHSNKDKFKVFIILPKDGPAVSYFRKLKAEVIILPLRKWYGFIYLFKLGRIMKNEGIDVLHTHEPRGNFFGLIAAKFAFVPKLISTRHDSYLSKYMKKGVYLKRKAHAFADRFVLCFYDKVIAVSFSIKEELVKLQKLPLSKVKVIPYGLAERQVLSVPQADSLREEFRLKRGEQSVGLIGRILPDKKGHIYFLEAAKIVLKKYPNLKFFLVGSGSDRNGFAKYINKLGIAKNVIFTGQRDDIGRFYQMFDLVVLPSLWEGLPLSILEAASYAKPILATKVGGIPEIIEDDLNGRLVPPADPDILAKEMQRILEDKERAKKFGAAAKNKAAQFTIGKMVSATEEIYLN